MSSDRSAPRRTTRRGGLVLVIIAAVIVAYGLTTRAKESRELKQWTDEQAVPTVTLISPTTDSSSASLELPARLEAFARAPIYARASGYLKSWKADIGTQVKAGQELGEIETPDLDQQLLQAKADVASAKVNAELAGTTAKRWQSMLNSDSVSRQEVDERVGDYAAKQAILQAAQANLDRVQANKVFTKLVAPFEGVVTARSTDIGALINVGSAAGLPLFVVSDTRKLRLYVSVPQNYASSIGKGAVAKVSIPGQPGKTYSATLVASSQSVDASSGTTLFQFLVPNPDGELLPGGFARVSLELPANTASLSIPASALIVRQDGLHVATLDANNQVALKEVTIARDLGKTIELSSGISADDKLVDSPADDISDGLVVRIAETKPEAKKP
ncbi:efflux RND transporter periplasmic adaptor subunit [Methylobacillus gramineus]|uniref:efflux RND transporter periplasmic adaptor subunit n=1 Tax=Methylobacillus gramineus TaxID=755169 RepID=UPI001CFF7AC7|nr:efflux RND transporter periplasmic adaptor subunit [Methylobacillus gramineus]MCB5186074.1 efflux RND transporter periplasmic adaptor subunit [Methylobacillus gramineus]